MSLLCSMSRPLIRIGLVLLASAGFGCGALDTFEQTIVDEATIPFTQTTQGPFSPAFGQGSFSSVNLSSLKEFQNNGVSAGDVDAIYVKSLTLDLATGSNNPAIDQLDNFITQVEFFVLAEGLPKQVIATKMVLPDTASTQLEITAGDMLPGFNLKPYAIAPSMSFGAEVMLKSPRAVNATLTTTIVLVVDINLLGV